VAINPQRQLGKVRDAERQSEVTSIQDGINQYALDNEGKYPSGIEVDTYKEVCDTEAVDSSSCPSDYVDLSDIVPDQLAAIPRDPQASDTNADTGYEAAKDEKGNIVVKAPNTEIDSSPKRAGTTLSVAYGLSNASYDNNKAITARSTGPRGAVFNGDGTKMFVAGHDKDKIYSYNLSTAYDIGSASYNQNFDVSGQGEEPKGMAFNGNGTKMFVVKDGNTDSLHSYDLSTAYDIGSASYNQTIDVSGQDARPAGVTFNGGGSKMFVVGFRDENVYSYNLSTAYDIGSASYNQSFDVLGQDGGPRDVAFNGDGTKMFVAGNQNDSLYSYNLSTAYDISSASYNQSYDVSGQDNKPAGVTFNGDGSKMYVAGYYHANVYSYNLSTAYDLGSASHNQGYDVAIRDGDPRGVTFNGDGTKMFVPGDDNRSIESYNLSTAYDLSSAGYNQSFYIGEDGSPLGMTFNGDGTKMFVVGEDSANVYSYNLSTAYDIGSASYNNQSFDVSGQDGTPAGVTFNGDGTKMFVAGDNNEHIYSYTLSTAYDLASASYNQSFDISGEEDEASGVAFNDDGSKMFVVGFTNDNVYSYDVSAAYDLSTASYNQSFDVSGQDKNPHGVTFNGDGRKMFMIGDNTDAVYRYSTTAEE
jgi:sugar lactone lactonase YvrE